MAGSTSFQSDLPASINRPISSASSGRGSCSRKIVPLNCLIRVRSAVEKPPCPIVFQTSETSGTNCSGDSFRLSSRLVKLPRGVRQTSSEKNVNRQRIRNQATLSGS